MICVTCSTPIEAGDYRLVGIQQGNWESQYAHQGSCEAEARDRLAQQRRARHPAVVEEITLEAGESLPHDTLPGPGLKRR